MLRVVLTGLVLLTAMPGEGRAQVSGAQVAGDGAWRWIQALIEPFAAVTDWMAGVLTPDQRLVNREIERFKATIDRDLGPFDQLVRAAGYRVGSVSLGASLTPRILLSMNFIRRLPQTEKAALLARISDGSGTVGTVERSVVMILLNAADSVYAVRGDGYRLGAVEIEVGVVPEVTFILNRNP
jgi:hypothetical protein